MRVADAQVGDHSELGGASAGDGQHRRTQIDPGHSDTGRVVRQAEPGADRHLQGPALGPPGELPPSATDEDLSRKAICLS